MQEDQKLTEIVQYYSVDEKLPCWKFVSGFFDGVKTDKGCRLRYSVYLVLPELSVADDKCLQDEMNARLGVWSTFHTLRVMKKQGKSKFFSRCLQETRTRTDPRKFAEIRHLKCFLC